MPVQDMSGSTSNFIRAQGMKADVGAQQKQSLVRAGESLGGSIGEAFAQKQIRDALAKEGLDPNIASAGPHAAVTALLDAHRRKLELQQDQQQADALRSALDSGAPMPEGATGMPAPPAPSMLSLNQPPATAPSGPGPLAPSPFPADMVPPAPKPAAMPADPRAAAFKRLMGTKGLGMSALTTGIKSMDDMFGPVAKAVDPSEVELRHAQAGYYNDRNETSRQIAETRGASSKEVAEVRGQASKDVAAANAASAAAVEASKSGDRKASQASLNEYRTKTVELRKQGLSERAAHYAAQIEVAKAHETEAGRHNLVGEAQGQAKIEADKTRLEVLTQWHAEVAREKGTDQRIRQIGEQLAAEARSLTPRTAIIDELEEAMKAVDTDVPPQPTIRAGQPAQPPAAPAPGANGASKATTGVVEDKPAGEKKGPPGKKEDIDFLQSQGATWSGTEWLDKDGKPLK